MGPANTCVVRAAPASRPWRTVFPSWVAPSIAPLPSSKPAIPVTVRAIPISGARSRGIDRSLAVFQSLMADPSITSNSASFLNRSRLMFGSSAYSFTPFRVLGLSGFHHWPSVSWPLILSKMACFSACSWAFSVAVGPPRNWSRWPGAAFASRNSAALGMVYGW